MRLGVGADPRPHDLLRLRAGAVVRAEVSAEQPPVEACLRDAPFAVVRRGRIVQGRVPVGVRGGSREERYAGFIAMADVLEVVRPETLRVSEDDASTAPAFRALRVLQQCWEDAEFLWGPVGSVGFALATGLDVVKAESDLDLVLRAPEPGRASWGRLAAELRELSCRGDALVKLPAGFVALSELASGAPRVLLRTVDGVQLVNHPCPDPACEMAGPELLLGERV